MRDIQHKENGDIDVSTGDILYCESTDQHKKDILLADKGGYKESPEIGVGAVSYINDTDPENFFRAVRREFTRDGMKVTKVSMDRTEAYYEKNNG